LPLKLNNPCSHLKEKSRSQTRGRKPGCENVIAANVTPQGRETKRNKDKPLAEKLSLAFILDLSERENDFILCLSNLVEEDPTRRIERGELYALAKANGFSEREVYRYAMDLDLFGYLKALPILGGKIASLSLTAQGVDYARGLRDQQKSL